MYLWHSLLQEHRLNSMISLLFRMCTLYSIVLIRVFYMYDILFRPSEAFFMYDLWILLYLLSCHYYIVAVNNNIIDFTNKLSQAIEYNSQP